jgi:1,4-dihydroxy-2-naphthoate octaprenyltransferase
MVRIWVMAARLRTLPAAVAPVLVGTSLARTEGHVPGRCAFIAALLGAIFIQVGTNLSNDYSDARRGADTEDRLGPVRVTAGGLVPPRQVLIATYVTFGLAVVCGAYLVYVAGPRCWRSVRHRSSPACLYTAGPRTVRLRGPGRGLRVPLLRHRRRDRLVLRAGGAARVGGVRAGCAGRPARGAILVVNNVRDIDTDRRAGKRTLAVRLGPPRARGRCYSLMLLVAYVTLIPVVFPLSAWVCCPS